MGVFSTQADGRTMDIGGNYQKRIRKDKTQGP